MMVRERWATFLVDKQAKALNLASAAILLIGTFIFAGPALAQPSDPCPTGQLGTGTGQDIVINRKCTVGMGTYNYGNVNIIAKGSLVFEENVRNEKIDFWAKSAVFLPTPPVSCRRTPSDSEFSAGCSPFIFTARTTALAERG
jgi:hypothetical protein